MMNGYWGWRMWGGAELMILFWAAVILLAIWAVWMLFPDRRSASSTSTPLVIARRRYSRGEISREEYLTLLAVLKPIKEKNNDTAA